MTNSRLFTFRDGWRHPSHFWVVAGLLGIVFTLCGTMTVSAHAEPERTSPPINGVVATVPAVVEIWFSEEVNSEGTTIQVIGPGGIQVDLGDATVDLQDAERKHVTVSLRSGLEDGVYTVQWHSLSGADGDEAQGGYIFTVGTASPVASPPVGEPTAVPSPTAISEAAATPVAAAPEEENDFDSTAFGLSVAAGLGVALLLYLFWRAVRPKKNELID